MAFDPFTNITSSDLAEFIRARVERPGLPHPGSRSVGVPATGHTFAVHALLRWYREGADLGAKLPFLSAYMGHVSPVSTEYYLPFVASLAGAASEKFAEHCKPLLESFEGLGGSL